MTEIFTTLGIEWQQLLAQIVNFTIVVVVLSFFVYRPVLKLLDDRRDRIQKSMKEVDRINQEKKNLDALKAEVLSKADAEAGEVLAKAKKQGEAMRQEIIDAGHREAADIIARGRKQLEQERRTVLQEVHTHLTGIIVGMAEKILARQFSAADQKKIVSSIEQEISSARV